MMGFMESKLDKSALLILLIPSALVAVGLVWSLTTGDPRTIAAMLLIAGALVMGVVRARRARHNSTAGTATSGSSVSDPT